MSDGNQKVDAHAYERWAAWRDELADAGMPWSDQEREMAAEYKRLRNLLEQILPSPKATT